MAYCFYVSAVIVSFVAGTRCRLEFVAQCKEQLVALVAYVYGIADVVVAGVVLVFVAHERIELAVGLAVLVGKVDGQLVV